MYIGLQQSPLLRPDELNCPIFWLLALPSIHVTLLAFSLAARLAQARL